MVTSEGEEAEFAQRIDSTLQEGEAIINRLEGWNSKQATAFTGG
jgi:hypothetical protein